MLRHVMGLGGLMVVGLLTLGAVGCGSDDKPKDETPPDPYPTFDAFCDGIASAECLQPVQDACALNGSGAGDACIGEVSSSCKSKSNDLTKNIKNTGNYRKDRAEACINTVRAVYTTARITSADHANILTACEKVFQGNAGKGFDCVEDLDCADGLGCYRADLSSDKGQCQTINLKTKGDDCSGVGDVCGVGLYCTPNDKICGARPDSGKTCAANKPCLESLLCTGIDEATGQGTCSSKKASSADATCASDGDCISNFCVQLGSSNACLDTVGFAAGAPVCSNFDGK